MWNVIQDNANMSHTSRLLKDNLCIRVTPTTQK